MANDNQLDILIRLITEEVGPEKAEAVLKRITAATKDSTKATAEGAKATDILTLRKQELGKVVGELSRAFPQLGNLMRLALDPRVLGITLTLKLFGMLNEQVKNLMTLLSPSEWQGRAGAIAAGGKAFEDASIQANKFWTEVQRGVTETENITEAMDGFIKKIRDEETAANQLREARKNLALAGVTDPVQRASIEASFEKEGSQAKTLADNRVLNAMLAERVMLMDRMEKMQRELPVLQARAAAAAADNAELDAERAIHTKNIAASETKIKELETEVEERRKFGTRSGVFNKLTDADVQSSLDSEIAARDRARGLLGRLNQDRVSRESANAGVISDAAVAEAEFRTASGRGRALDRQIEDFRGDYQRGIRTRDAVAAYDAAARSGSPNAGMLMRAAEGADVIMGGGRATAAQAQAINTGARALGLEGQNAETILRIMSAFNDRAEILERGLKQIEQRVANQRHLN